MFLTKIHRVNIFLQIKYQIHNAHITDILPISALVICRNLATVVTSKGVPSWVHSIMSHQF